MITAAETPPHRHIPVIDRISQLKDLPNIDQDKDVDMLWPLYQNGKLVAYRRIIYLHPTKKDYDPTGKAYEWGSEKLVINPKIEDEYFPE